MGWPTNERGHRVFHHRHAKPDARHSPGIARQGSGAAGEGQLPVELGIDTRGPGAGFIELAHDTRTTTREPEPVTYRIWLMTSRPNYGGRRYWFICPNSGQRAAKLYLPLGGHRLPYAEQPPQLGYACQRETKTDRLMRKARKLHRALGGGGNGLGQLPPGKAEGYALADLRRDGRPVGRCRRTGRHGIRFPDTPAAPTPHARLSGQPMSRFSGPLRAPARARFQGAPTDRISRRLLGKSWGSLPSPARGSTLNY